MGLRYWCETDNAGTPRFIDSLMDWMEKWPGRLGYFCFPVVILVAALSFFPLLVLGLFFWGFDSLKRTGGGL